MLKRFAFVWTTAAVALSVAGMPLPAAAPGHNPHGFNDKMLILHQGREMCVDWWAWPGHMIQHGDDLLGSCDVPQTGE
jgi:hypothetical protein